MIQHRRARACLPLAILLGTLLLCNGGFPAFAGSVPANDQFMNATPVGSVPFAATVATAGAGREGAEPHSGCSPDRPATVWYRVSLSNAADVRVDTIGSHFDTSLDVFRGTSLAALSSVACDDDIDSLDGTLSESRLTFRAAASTTYYIRLSWTGGGTAAVLHLARATRPANDDFGHATTIARLPFHADPVTANATVQANEPNACPRTQASLWYRYVAPATTTLEVDTFGSSFDTTLSVFQGTSLGHLSLLLCSNDTNYSGGPVRASSVTFHAVKGAEYRFRVGGHNGDNGALQLNVHRVTPVPNDDFGHAITLQYVPLTFSTNTRRATHQAGEPYPSTCGYNTAWYRFIAPSDGDVTFQVADVNAHGKLALYDGGTALGNLHLVGCGFSVGVTATQGHVYWLRVTNEPGYSGPLTVTITH